MKKLKLALAYFLLPAAGIAISFESYAVSCGDTITSQETLTQDLVCATNPALTITGPLGGLDMDGFTVTCSASTDDGILLNGLSASLTSGVIDNCNNSIMLQDDGSHYVTSVDIDDPDGVGVLISSDSNFVTGIQIQSDGVTSRNGIETEDPANYNQIIGNTIDSTGGDGIYLEG
ncbi:right-handed parallel beta-helix repeat-containing protein [Microbulbifer sp. MKSA007]|nr:right-handed parallel beta-helix repeat-containing protein [Microbulbifer sp. MKSA007]